MPWVTYQVQNHAPADAGKMTCVGCWSTVRSRPRFRSRSPRRPRSRTRLRRRESGLGPGSPGGQTDRRRLLRLRLACVTDGPRSGVGARGCSASYWASRPLPRRYTSYHLRNVHTVRCSIYIACFSFVLNSRVFQIEDNFIVTASSQLGRVR